MVRAWLSEIFYTRTKTRPSQVLQLCTSISNANWSAIHALWLTKLILIIIHQWELYRIWNNLSQLLIGSWPFRENSNPCFSQTLENYWKRLLSSYTFHGISKLKRLPESLRSTGSESVYELKVHWKDSWENYFKLLLCLLEVSIVWNFGRPW